MGNDNSITGMTQYGASNTMNVYQRSNGNEVGYLIQDTNGTPTTSPSNFMQIVQENGNNNTIGHGSQDGTGNDMRLTQSGGSNVITTATQGDFNVTAPNNTNYAKMSITQSGYRNVVDAAEQFGTSNTMTLNVTGNDNGTTAMSSEVVTPLAIGKANLSQAGTGNLTTVSLMGSDNSFSFVQSGGTTTRSTVPLAAIATRSPRTSTMGPTTRSASTSLAATTLLASIRPELATSLTPRWPGTAASRA